MFDCHATGDVKVGKHGNMKVDIKHYLQLYGT